MRQHPTGQKTHRSECHLHISVDGEHVASPAQQVSNIKEEEDWPKDRTLQNSK